MLIVEDDDTLRDSCASVLATDGYTVATTGVAQEAQALLGHRTTFYRLMERHGLERDAS